MRCPSGTGGLGHRVEQVTFTKMILHTLGKCHGPFLFNMTCQNSDTPHVLSGKSYIVHRKDMQIGLNKLLASLSYEPVIFQTAEDKDGLCEGRA